MASAVAVEEFPASLVKDATKIGKSYNATLVHFDKLEKTLFLSMNNGVLVLKKDGTWVWEERE